MRVAIDPIMLAVARGRLTPLEADAIKGILDSDFMDGAKGNQVINRLIWTWSANPFVDKKTFSGVISSLAKKGYVNVDHNRGKNTDDWTICITAAGYNSYMGKE